ncbi:MAG: ATP-grasp domain-containing protein [Luteibaculum sp.]
MKQTILLITEDRYIEKKQGDVYVENIHQEDEILAEALKKLGISSRRVSWSDPQVAWEDYPLAIFRTTWDYFHRFKEFEHWLKNTETKIRLINPSKVIYWNLHKKYLIELAGKGIRIPATSIFKKNSTCDLLSIMERNGWDDMVIKPAISGAARETYRVNSNNIEDMQVIMNALINQEDMLCQEFLYPIMKKGEVSVMAFADKITHAVLKQGKSGDFRVQDDFGGTVKMVPLTQELEDFTSLCLSKLGFNPLYARVDVAVNNSGQLCLTELELIEPELWFRLCPESADAFALAIERELSACFST